MLTYSRRGLVLSATGRALSPEREGVGGRLGDGFAYYFYEECFFLCLFNPVLMADKMGERLLQVICIRWLLVQSKRCE